MDQAENIPPGTTLGRYSVVRRIGVGGMGAVYEGRHVDLDKRVAIKVLLPQLVSSEEVRARFRREGEAASRIRHPNVVDVYDVISDTTLTYLVMEYLEGEDLGARLKREGRLEPHAIATIFVPICAGLWAAHDAGIIHRDMKPANIFLSRGPHGEEIPKLLDFGISKVVSQDPMQGLTTSGMLLGTPYYMSPEQAQGEKALDPRSDQYSVGVILYQCVTGVKPFEADSMYKILHKIVQGTFVPPHVHAPSLPDGFEAVVLKAMANDPDDRYPDMGGLGRALLDFASARSRALFAPTFGLDFGSHDLTEHVERRDAPKSSGSRVDSGVAGPSSEARSERAGKEAGGSLGNGQAAAFSDPSAREGEGPLAHTLGSSGSLLRPAPRPGRVALTLSLVALAGAAGLLIYVLVPSKAVPVSTTPMSRGAPEDGSVGAPTFDVRVRTWPEDAVISIDGAQVGRGSFAGKLPMDGRKRKLEVSATGHQSFQTAFSNSPPPDWVRLEPIEGAPRMKDPLPTAQPSGPASAGAKPHGGKKPGDRPGETRGEKPSAKPRTTTDTEARTEGGRRDAGGSTIQRGTNEAPIIR